VKTCTKCDVDKPLDEFGRDKKSPDGRAWRCKACASAEFRAWRAANPEAAKAAARRWQDAHPERKAAYDRRHYRKHHDKIRDAAFEQRLIARYGITQAEYDELLARQDGLCAICRRPPGAKRLHVDHEHGTGVVRGLLCVSCNMKLGVLEKREWRGSAEAYLSVHSQ